MQKVKRKRIIHGVHGIWTEGAKSVDQVGFRLQRSGDFTYSDYNYPYYRLIEQRSQTKLTRNAEGLAEIMQDGDHVLAHSNGASIVHKAMHLNQEVRLGVIILVAPAFGSKTAWPMWGFDRMVVMHNPHDLAVFVGQLLYKHKFGALGRIGYRGRTDARIRNISIKNAKGSDWPINHSWMFRGKQLDNTTAQIRRIIDGYERFKSGVSDKRKTT